MLENDIECAGWSSHTWHKEEGNGWNINQTEINDSNDVGYFRVGKSHVVDEAWIVFNGADIGMPGLGQVWMVVAILDERFVIRCQLNPYGQRLGDLASTVIRHISNPFTICFYLYITLALGCFVLALTTYSQL